MQHQQGIAVHPSGRLLVADSYNDALKWVDPATRRVETWLRGFHEPGGLAVGGGRVYVADTNAHRVMVVEESGEMGEVEIEE
jgi:DNA-binding beta-propeller fold protein YncE